jgi:restriction endonuclease
VLQLWWLSRSSINLTEALSGVGYLQMDDGTNEMESESVGNPLDRILGNKEKLLSAGRHLHDP